MQDWEAAFVELRSEFVEEGRLKLDDIAVRLAALRCDPEDGKALQALMRRFHGFAGSGTTYGFPRLTELARQAEQECAALLQSASAPAPGDVQRWGSVLSQIRAELAAGASLRPTPSRPAPEPAQPGTDILIVDDDVQLVELLSRLALEEGLTVRGVTTTAAAIQAVSERIPDGMVVDIRLPDGSGYDVVKHVRSLPNGEVPAILILSMLTGFLDKVEAIHCGADGYFEKPVDWDALMRRMVHLLRKLNADTPRVLSVEDDPLQAAFLRKVLESAGYEFRLCDDPKRFEFELTAFRPDLVLMDIMLPGMSGFDLVRYVRQDERYATLPVLFLTTDGQMDAQIRAAQAGGDDHLTKPVSPSLLLTAVAARIERSRFLKTLLERDGLTRLLTHSAFVERAQRAVARKGRAPEWRAGWVMIDLDDFKDVNDRHGHPVGDRVLRSLAALLRRKLRQTDVVGRYGGEEFAVLVEDLDESDALRLMNRLREDFAAIEHAAVGGPGFHTTFSAGVAMIEPGAGVNAWRRAADEALYAAKKAGRNRVVAASGKSPAAILRHPRAERRDGAPFLRASRS
jgi:diguanylate cyclase (GGDEF)-like protein